MNPLPSPTTTTTTNNDPKNPAKRKPHRLHIPTTLRLRKTTIHILPLLNFLLLLACSFLLLRTLLSLISYLTLITTHIPPLPPNGCNGHPELCTRRYSNITHIGTHDSAFVGILPTQNQDVTPTTQLESGIRFLTVQAHENHLGQLALCHTDCLMEDAGLLRDYLVEIREWLERPERGNEVVTLLLTNPERRIMSAFEEAYIDSGIVKYVFTPPPPPNKSGGAARALELNDWPTLQDLISSSQRLVSFMDYTANTTLAPYLLPEFAYFWENPFDSTAPSSLTTCNIDRPGPLSTEQEQGYMYILNHFLDTDVLGLDLPDRRDAGGTNLERSLRTQMDVCEGKWGRRAWGVLVDYFERGEVVRVMDEWNGVG